MHILRTIASILRGPRERLERLQDQLLLAEHQHRKVLTRFEALLKEKKLVDDRLASVYELARALGAATNLDEAVGIVQGMIRRLQVPYQSCVVLVYRGDKLSPVRPETRYRKVLGMTHLLQLEEALIKEVVETRKPRLNAQLPPGSEDRIFKDECSALCAPLLVGRDLIGVIYLGSERAGTHTAEHLEQLKFLANFAAPTLKTTRMLEDKEKDLSFEREIRAAVEAKNAQLAGLQQMGQRMGRSLKSQETISVVAEALKEMIGEAQSVILFTPERQEEPTLRAEFAYTPYSAYVRNISLRADEGLLGKAIALRQTLLISSTDRFGVQNLLGSESSVVVAPLLGGEDSENSELLGVLYLGSDRENALNEEHRSLVETVSYQTAMALKNARLYEQTQLLALTDGLTGLYTHRLFQEKLGEELEWARLHSENVVLVMVDADNFKTYNDTLGHPAGDALLIEIANLLRDKVRASDIVCRYGGDEFALLLRQTTKEEARKLCERVREAFLLRFGGHSVRVTSSIGLACFPVDAKTKSGLARAADDALYLAKRGGRNRVAVSKTFQERQLPPIVAEVLVR